MDGDSGALAVEHPWRALTIKGCEVADAIKKHVETRTWRIPDGFYALRVGIVMERKLSSIACRAKVVL